MGNSDSIAEDHIHTDITYNIQGSHGSTVSNRLLGEEAGVRGGGL